METLATLRVMVDNLADEGLTVEHGFSAWVEAGDERVLLDTGAGAALAPNAERLGIDPARASAIVLSHGHYDHTGGLPFALSRGSSAGLYFAPDVDRDRFSRHPDREPRAIGMTAEARVAMRALPASRLHETRETRLLAPGIGLTGPIPRSCPFEDTGGPFFFDAVGDRADPINDDQALWLETEGGLVVVVGCCHAGIVNTVERVRAATGLVRVRGIVGGLHLLHASEERLERTIAALRSWNLDFLVPCHCTGERAVAALRSDLGDAVVRPGRAGMTVVMGELRR